MATNLSQITILARRATARDRLGGKGLRILSELDAKGDGMARVLTGYALTSANDRPGADPRNWRLLGSNDDGKSWNLLDERRDELFAGRFERRVFALTNPAACTLYRWEIQAVLHGLTRIPFQSVKISEIRVKKLCALLWQTESVFNQPPANPVNPVKKKIRAIRAGF